MKIIGYDDMHNYKTYYKSQPINKSLHRIAFSNVYQDDECKQKLRIEKLEKILEKKLEKILEKI